MKRKLLVVGTLLLSSLWWFNSHPPAEASDTVTLRMGSLAPRGSSWARLFGAFDRSVQKKTQGRLRVNLYPGGVAGDERDVIRKMKLGQMDGAVLTSVGLGQIVRQVLVLQLPGLFENPGQLAKVRRELDAEFRAQFDRAGYVFMGWGDVGDRRVFSNKPILGPEDFKSTRPWVWRDDPITPALMDLIGANGVPLGLPEVFPALQTGMVNTVTATAVSAVALQWFRNVSHMSKSTGEPVVGATVIRKSVYEALAPDLREVLDEDSARTHALLLERIRKEDRMAAKTLLKRGMKEFDMMSRRADWEPLLGKLAERLMGTVYSRELLERVFSTARGKPLSSFLAKSS